MDSYIITDSLAHDRQDSRVQDAAQASRARQARRAARRERATKRSGSRTVAAFTAVARPMHDWLAAGQL